MEAQKESNPTIPPEKNSLLIGEVKKFPSLYDTSDPNYYVLAERNKAWLRVAENCDEPAELCHLRWKSLRKRYAKEKRRFPEILAGRRRPWTLFPKMSFLAPATAKRRVKPVKARRKSEPSKSNSKPAEGYKQNVSDDDMLIVDDNDEIVHTCKTTVEISEDEYIYETLDDPDSALEMMKNTTSSVKQTAIRSGMTASSLSLHTTSSGRIRKLTPKMQNSIIAKKLKQAQQILHQASVPTGNSGMSQKPKSFSKNVVVVPKTSNKSPAEDRSKLENTVPNQDKTRHVATVNPNIVRVERSGDKESPSTSTTATVTTPTKQNVDQSVADNSRPFKVIKLKGRNPIIFSPEQLPDIQSFLKSEAAANHEQDEAKPLIKVKSVDHLNKQNASCSSENESNNLDIIHSLGLVRKTTAEKSTGVDKDKSIHPNSYSRAYSWNRPTTKTANKQTLTEHTQPDSQTKDYEIEESWNDIKEENIDDMPWPNSPYMDNPSQYMESMNPPPEPHGRLTEAKLELVAYQRKLLEEQHKKTMEYMRREHEMKMALLKTELDLKRKQLNIMM